MDNDVLGVDQNPVGDRKPLDAHITAELALDAFGKLLRHRRDLPGRAPGGDDHIVGDVRFSRKGNGHDLDGLVVV